MRKPDDFPDEWSCTAWEDCQHDGICHDPKTCGAIGPNHHAFYDMQDDEVDADEGPRMTSTDDAIRALIAARAALILGIAIGFAAGVAAALIFI